jgi:hypothetical protein
MSARPLPAEPTDALPGSEEKIRVLAQRAERGEQLWHPLDRRGQDATSTLSGLSPQARAGPVRIYQAPGWIEVA